MNKIQVNKISIKYKSSQSKVDFAYFSFKTFLIKYMFLRVEFSAQ